MFVIPAAAILLVGAIIATILIVSNSDDEGGGELFLQNISEQGPDPFGPSVSGPTPPSTIPPDTPITFPSGGTAPVFRPPVGGTPTGGTVSVTSRSGGTPGLYGGTRDQKSCNVQQMIDFLLANADKAKAWADTQGIAVGELASYIGALTPVLLRSDTRVTNHGFKNGKPNPIQSVLQAGTAVLVDKFGVPRTRCACGNPLIPPTARRGPPTYRGTPWPGYDPTNITVINNSTTVINIITIIDVRTGEPFGRPLGPTGPDVNLPPGGSTTTSGRGATTTRGPTTTAAATADFRLTNVEPKNGKPDAYQVDANQGTARLVTTPNTAEYRWTVPQVIRPSGTEVTYGGTAKGNTSIDINVYADTPGPVFSIPSVDDRHAHAYDPASTPSASMTVTITVPDSSVRKFTIKYGMGYAVEVLYTYER